MSYNPDNIVYSAQVLEFVTVSKEFCSLLENSSRFEKVEFIDKMQKLLSFLYLKTLVLPEIEQINEQGNEKFVTELDWNLIRDNVNTSLGEQDSYLDFFDHMMQETSEPVTCSISENMADIYQDVKDFLTLYQLNIVPIMNDGLYECCHNFKHYWGQRALVSLVRLHHAVFNEGLPQENINVKSLDTNKWFISKRQQDFSNDGSGIC